MGHLTIDEVKESLLLFNYLDVDCIRQVLNNKARLSIKIQLFYFYESGFRLIYVLV